jgi:hypothetical protein
MFNGLAVLSLMLLLATSALLARSFFYEDQIAIRSTFYFRALSSWGGLELYLEPHFQKGIWAPAFEAQRFRQRDWGAVKYPRAYWTLGHDGHRLLGFEYGSTFAPAGWFEPEKRERALVVPDLALLILLLILPLMWLRRLMRTSAHGRTGLCKNCGYDLTGNVSGICPECGTPISKRILL